MVCYRAIRHVQHTARLRTYDVLRSCLSDVELSHDGLRAQAMTGETDAIMMWLKITATAEALNLVFHDPRRFRILRSLPVICKPSTLP